MSRADVETTTLSEVRNALQRIVLNAQTVAMAGLATDWPEDEGVLFRLQGIAEDVEDLENELLQLYNKERKTT